MRSHYLDQKIDRSIQVGGKEYLFFSGTSYLGIGAVASYQEILLENIRKLGFHHGLSRVNNVRLQVFEEFETSFAENAGAETSAVMSSGYLAGIAAWQWLYPQQDICWIAPDIHPAILPSEIKPEIQLNFVQWKKQCLELSEQLSPQRIFIIGNAVDPLRVEIHEYSWVNEIAKKHEVTLLIDDSHAFGTIGSSIFGTYSMNLESSFNLVVSGSLGKGLALPAGIILGNRKTIQGIKSQPIFTSASPSSPANLQTFLETQPLYMQQFQKSHQLTELFYSKIQDLSTLNGRRDFPIFRYLNSHWAETLEQEGFITSSFSYPLPDSPKVNRIVISGFHQIEDLESLSLVLHQF